MKLLKWINENQGEKCLYLSKRQWNIRLILSFLFVGIGYLFWSKIETQSEYLTFEILFNFIVGICFVSTGGRLLGFNFSYKMYLSERKHELEEQKKELLQILEMD